MSWRESGVSPTSAAHVALLALSSVPLQLQLLPALLGSAMLCGGACVLLGHPLRLNLSYPPPLHAHAHEKHPVR